ncbi:hypothetical protein UlMin_046070 [Ulmus minor]
MSKDHTIGSESILWENYLSNSNKLGNGGTGGGEGKTAVAIDGTREGRLQRIKKSRASVGENEKTGNGDRKVKPRGIDNSNHDFHKWTERERRKKMKSMFNNLHELLPQLAPKADESTILIEAVKYIRNLKETLEELQEQKEKKIQQNHAYNSIEAVVADQGSSSDLFNMKSNFDNLNINPMSSLSVSAHSPVSFQTWTSPHVILSICGNQAYINICSSPKKPGLFTTICYVLEKYMITVVAAQISSDSNRNMYMIHTHVDASDQFFDGFPVEEIFKQAVREIMSFVIFP